MSDTSDAVKALKERLADGTEDRLGKALTDLLENPLLTGFVGRAFDARKTAAQAQEVAMGAFNIPSAADVERLTRRLRSVSQRLEGIEDGVHRLDRALSGRGVDERLSAIEDQLGTITRRLGQAAGSVAKVGSGSGSGARSAGKTGSGAQAGSGAKVTGRGPKAASAAKAKPAARGAAKPGKAKAVAKAKAAAQAKTAAKAKPKKA
jgi:hypothetical protein